MIRNHIDHIYIQLAAHASVFDAVSNIVSLKNLFHSPGKCGAFRQFFDQVLIQAQLFGPFRRPPVHGQTYRSAEPFLIDFLDVSFYVF